MNNKISIVPDYSENQDKAAEYLRMVLPMISKCKIPANPINYSLCYEYVSGTNQPLKEQLDLHLKQDQPISAEVSNQLYRKFVLNGSADKFDRIGNGLRHLVQQTMTTLESTGMQASSSADTFTSKTELLSSTEDLSVVKEVVQSIISETRDLAEASHGLKDRLNDTSAEVNELRAELEKMKQAAQTDALTGLLNRRAFDSEMTELIANSDELIGKTFLLLLDIDHFKRVNDTYGHLVGDKVLRYTAKLLQQFVGERGMAARYGGEEMAILLRNTDTASALATANEIREALASSRLQRKDNGDPIGQITLSAGVSCLQATDSIESLIDRADSALYKAKESGRNRVIDGNPDNAHSAVA